MERIFLKDLLDCHERINLCLEIIDNEYNFLKSLLWQQQSVVNRTNKQAGGCKARIFVQHASNIYNFIDLPLLKSCYIIVLFLDYPKRNYKVSTLDLNLHTLLTDAEPNILARFSLLQFIIHCICFHVSDSNIISTYDFCNI